MYAIARSSWSPSGARRVVPSSMASCMWVAASVMLVCRSRSISAALSMSKGLLLPVVIQPGLPSSPAYTCTEPNSLSHNKTACPWLLRSTITGARLYQPANDST